MQRHGQDERPLATRRPHQKSRAGCADCRRRRVKCDETRPKCHQCVRRDIACIYPSQPASAASSPQSLSSAGVISAGNGAAPAALKTIPGSTPADGFEISMQKVHFTARHMALLHQWTMETSSSIVKGHPDLLHFWQTVFPEVGFQYPFVLYGIFSLAALHHAHIYPEGRKQFVAEASQHHNLLIQGLQAATERIEKNCEAIVVSATFNIIYVFGMYGWIYDTEETSATRRSRILGSDWIPMIQGVQAVLHPVNMLIRDGPLSPLLDTSLWDAIDLETDKPSNDPILHSLSTTWSGSSESQIYEDCLLLLRRCFAYMERVPFIDRGAQGGYYNQALSGPTIWIALVPDKYFALLAQRQPPALVVFAYLGTLLHRLNGYWYYHGWGRSIVETVDELLGEYWVASMKWPKEFVSSDDHAA